MEDATPDLATPLSRAPRTGYLQGSAPTVLEKRRRAAAAAAAAPAKPHWHVVSICMSWAEQVRCYCSGADSSACAMNSIKGGPQHEQPILAARAES